MCYSYQLHVLFCKSLFCLSRCVAWCRGTRVQMHQLWVFVSLALTHWPGSIPGTTQSTCYVIYYNYMYCLLCYCLVILFLWGWCRWDLVPVCVCIGIYVCIYMFIYTCIYLCVYKVEFCLLLWLIDLLSFDALLYFYDNKYVVILILILKKFSSLAVPEVVKRHLPVQPVMKNSSSCRYFLR